MEENEYLELKKENGEIVHRFPMVHFVLNRDQQIVCIGSDIDLKIYGGIENMLMPVKGVKNTYLGQLENIEIIFAIQIKNSLYNVGWNYDKYPNPYIILLTKES